MVDLKLDKSGVYGYTEQEMRQLEELWELHNPGMPESQPEDRGGGHWIWRNRELIQPGGQGEGGKDCSTGGE